MCQALRYIMKRTEINALGIAVASFTFLASMLLYISKALVQTQTNISYLCSTSENQSISSSKTWAEKQIRVTISEKTNLISIRVVPQSPLKGIQRVKGRLFQTLLARLSCTSQCMQRGSGQEASIEVPPSHMSSLG